MPAEPGFPANELDREREVQIAGIHARKDDLLKSASVAMRRELFGDTGYGLDLLGTEESVGKISTGDLRAFHQKLTVPNNCVLAIYGDVKVSDVRKAVEQAFAGWRKNPEADKLIRTSPSPLLTSPKRVEEMRDQKTGRAGHRFYRHYDGQRGPLRVGRFAGNGCSDLGSRLFLAHPRTAWPRLLRRRAESGRTCSRLLSRFTPAPSRPRPRRWKRNCSKRRNCCARKD